ncbi:MULTISPECIES: hypothetical protein [Vibrio harveyi group]|uniref:hypothetical protein n=1 Tax=Vibrio harveyi group TaxID=717610 RepID=UPI000399F29C|nr:MULTISPECIES: hypothetical protein [Vibrio harveyi group]MCE7732634.1 hypothetical protein [Vibrio campbellii]
MKRTNSQGFLVRYQYPQRLSQWRESFASQFEPIKPAHEPLEPFMTVTDDVLTVRDARHGLRFAYLLPLVIGLWVLSFLFIDRIGPHPDEVAYAKEKISYYENKEREGLPYDKQRKDYFEAFFSENGDYSFWNYLNAVANYSSERHRESVYFYVSISLIALFLAISATVFFVKSPKPAHIYFDRKRGLVYTWFFGRLAACRFENLGFLERKTGLLLYLYCENKKRKGGYDVFPITVQPTGKVHLNSERDNNYFFAQVFNFMDNGKSAVITGKSFHRPESKTYFFIDKRPEPFEERLEKLLEHEHVLPDLYENLKVLN